MSDREREADLVVKRGSLLALLLDEDVCVCVKVSEQSDAEKDGKGAAAAPGTTSQGKSSRQLTQACSSATQREREVLHEQRGILPPSPPPSKP